MASLPDRLEVGRAAGRGRPALGGWPGAGALARRGRRGVVHVRGGTVARAMRAGSGGGPRAVGRALRRGTRPMRVGLGGGGARALGGPPLGGGARARGVGSGGVGSALGGGLRAMNAGAGYGSGGVGGALRGGSGLGTGGLREKVLRIAPHLAGARGTA